MLTDICPSRDDAQPHIYENGCCALCLSVLPVRRGRRLGITSATDCHTAIQTVRGASGKWGKDDGYEPGPKPAVGQWNELYDFRKAVRAQFRRLTDEQWCRKYRPTGGHASHSYVTPQPTDTGDWLTLPVPFKRMTAAQRKAALGKELTRLRKG